MKSRVTLSGSGAYGGTPELWVFKNELGYADGIYFDEAGTQEVLLNITMPTVECFAVTGFYYGETMFVDANGIIVAAARETLENIASDYTLEPHTQRVSWKITLDHNGGTSEMGCFYYRIDGGGFYEDDKCTGEQIHYAELPMRPMYRTTGYFLGSTKYINGGDASFTSALENATVANNYTLSAEWERSFYKLTLDSAGGSGGLAAIYQMTNNGGLWEDLGETRIVGAIATPTRTGYEFNGFYYGTFCGVDANGNVSSALASMALDRDYTLQAQWVGNTYTLGLPNASPSTKTVTFGSAIGTLPTPTVAAGHRFVGWAIDGTTIGADTIWSWASDKDAVAQTLRSFGSVFDYFGFGSSNLVPIESDSGEEKPRIVTRHYGKFKGGNSGSTSFNGADAASSLVWRNPTVKYMVVGDVAFTIQLGRAWRGTAGNAFSQGATGYMITSATIETRERSFPIITVSATANEGVNAVNQFSVTVNVYARARAQSLMGAISPGTGHLQSCRLEASCDPVVLAENMVPCASDVVNGRIDVSAEVLFADIGNRTEPSAGTGFSLVSREETYGGTAYNGHRIAVRKEL